VPQENAKGAAFKRRGRAFCIRRAAGGVLRVFYFTFITGDFRMDEYRMAAEQLSRFSQMPREEQRCAGTIEIYLRHMRAFAA